MKVLSLFDWISCGYEALIRAWIPVDEYYASEIDKHAIKVALKNHPDIVEIGDVCQVKGEDYQGVDLVIWWSPCQWFSFAGKMLNFDDPRSKLFFEFVRVVREVKPKFFLLENVKMKKEFIEVINEQLRWITPTLIDSALVSAQHRERNYRVGKLQEDGTYTKVEIPQPEDRWLLLKDVLQESLDEKYYLRDWQLKNYERSFWSKWKLQEWDKCDTITASMWTWWWNCHIIDESLYFTQEKIDQIANWKCYEKPLERAKTWEEKSDTLTTHCGKDSWWMKLVKIPCATQIGNSKNFGNAYGSEKAYTLRACNPNGVIEWTQPMRIRKLTPIECERLQTLPDNYTEWVSNSQRYKALWNWRNVDTIAHIFSFLK